ncbi:peptidoglycan recognition protein family protein [Streptomyces syringium]|uniref:peptidoglycan recognition protein family protein n=1 Tax=Streptomyces syringium TaxID=76729 RepID=UPI0034546FC4
MAAPLSADQFLAALRAEGVRVVEVGAWRTHNRNARGAWGPVHGVVIHHTVTSGTQDSVDLCYDGYNELPGPLCHGVIDKTGTVHLVGYGRTNHAGSGDSSVLGAVIEESALPRPTSNDVDGNARFYGFECINLGDGRDPWPAAQLEAIERVSAALCRAHSWGSGSVIGHKEWTNTKIDPVGFTMPEMRTRIAKRLGGQSDPDPTTPQESSVPYTLGEYSGTAVTLPPNQWTTLKIGADADLITDAQAYTATVYLTVAAPEGSTLQGRFYHRRRDGSRWDAAIVERQATPGSSFVDFSHSGSISDGETVRFEITYGPADTTDTKPATITTARARGLYWK